MNARRVEYTCLTPGNRSRGSMTVREAQERIGSRLISGWGVVSYTTRTRQGTPVIVVGIVSDHNGVWAIYALPM